MPPQNTDRGEVNGIIAAKTVAYDINGTTSTQVINDYFYSNFANGNVVNNQVDFTTPDDKIFLVPKTKYNCRNVYIGYCGDGVLDSAIYDTTDTDGV